MSVTDAQYAIFFGIVGIIITLSFMPTIVLLLKEDMKSARPALKVYAVIQLILFIALIVYLSGLTPEDVEAFRQF